MAEGKLEKVSIYAYNHADYAQEHQVGEVFKAMINPESYVLDYKVEFNDGQGQGTSASQQKFVLKKPEDMQFEFLFDATGIIDGEPRDSVHDEVEAFREMLLGYDSASHEPRHFKLVYGPFLFKGRCHSLTITYKLFNPDGSPIRAVCKAGFKGSIEDELRVATENAQSPDLTHRWEVKEGESLPWICYQVYGDPRYYLEVARVNGLNQFRQLESGQWLYLPPLSKS